jgi:hypothetical protein
MQFDKPRSLFGLVAAALTGAYDPDRDARVAKYVARLNPIIAAKKRTFCFADAVVALQISDYDRPYVAEKLYQQFLTRAWMDKELTDEETMLLQWAANELGIAPAKIVDLNSIAALSVFRERLGNAMKDGVVDAQEADHLRRVAVRCGTTVESLMVGMMANEGEAFIRNIFSTHAASGVLRAERWTTLIDTTKRLGMPRHQVLHAIEKPAKKLVEHTLADARSDGEITAEEEATITFLLDNTIGDAGFCQYVREVVADTKEATNISRGILPVVSAPGAVALRAGELVHWHGYVYYSRVRETASGVKQTGVSGQGVITDFRFVMSAPDASFQIAHTKVLGHQRVSDTLEIRTSSKWAGSYRLDDQKHRAAQIWQVAIGRANQTIVARDTTQASRHISRDVRQRVWQKYGGQCAECGSDSYLEFDHIVPVAKGGSNSDSNVQLLCRKCNLAKSDRI